MRTHLRIVLLAGCLLATSAQTVSQVLARAPDEQFRPSIATSPGWALEPKDFLGIKLGKPVAEQTAVRPCDSVAYDKNLFCYVDAPVFTHFRNMPDLGFAYEVLFLTSGRAMVTSHFDSRSDLEDGVTVSEMSELEARALCAREGIAFFWPMSAASR